MNNKHTSHIAKHAGRALLLCAISGLILTTTGIMAVGIFGTREQYDRTKELLPLLIGFLTPLLTAAITFYFPNKA